MPNIERQDEFIRSLGVEAYRVGGSVRDEILGRQPKDADYIVRGASLNALHALLLKARIERGRPRGDRISPLTDRQGQQFGWRYAGIEISLPRKEANAGDGRKQIITVDPNLSLAEDAKRRDFTFNALYRPIGGRNPYAGMLVLDPTGTGESDLRRRIIRTTHPDSFRDDPLRMLRALRFVSALDADIANETWIQMRQHAGEASGLTHTGHTSGTVFDEFSKLLMGQAPERALHLAAGTIIPHVMPELADMIGFEGGPYHDLTVDEHTFRAIQTAANVDAPLSVRWALLFHDAGKPKVAWADKDGRRHFYAMDAGNITYHERNGIGYRLDSLIDHEVISERLWRAAARRMNVPRKFTDEVATLIREHMIADKHRSPQVWVNRMRAKLGDEMLRDLFMHRMCDASGKRLRSGYFPGVTHYADLERARRKAAAENVPVSVKDLEIDGRDVEHLRGPRRGEVLRSILDEVVCDPSFLKRSREWQLSRIPSA